MTRMSWIDKIISAAIILLLFALLSEKPKAAPPEVPLMVFEAKEDGVVAQFFSRPCDDPRIVGVVQSARPDLPPLRDAESVFRMKTGEWRPYAGCWTEVSKQEVGFDAVVFIAEDGDALLLDKRKFQKGSSI